MKLKIYVLYFDLGQQEGCNPPEKITLDEHEALLWANEHAEQCYREFEIELPLTSGLEAGKEQDDSAS